MARYVDADTLIAHLEDEIRECKPPQGGRAGGKSIAYGTMLGLKSAIAFADALPTADVAPRSEVAREIIEETEEIRGEFLQGNLAGADVIVKLFLLKQKYTEGQK